jgi:hypothetical protein
MLVALCETLVGVASISAAIGFARAKWLRGWIFASIAILLFVAGGILQNVAFRPAFADRAVGVNHKADSAAMLFGPSAEWIVDAALAKAKLQDKRVLVCLGSPPCSACRVLAQFLKSRSQLFEDDYVIAMVDPYDMEMGRAVEHGLRKGRDDGDPWMVILDADGRELISSDGPNGNIGYPSRPEEISHFVNMIEKTGKRMSAQQIGAVRKALEGNSARRKVERGSPVAASPSAEDSAVAQETRGPETGGGGRPAPSAGSASLSSGDRNDPRDKPVAFGK